jgi:subtilisin family serine protease
MPSPRRRLLAVSFLRTSECDTLNHTTTKPIRARLLIWLLFLALGIPASAQQQKPADPIGAEPSGEQLTVTASKLPAKTNEVTAAAVNSAFGEAKSGANVYRLVPISGGKDVYTALSVEFKSAAARTAFRDTDVTVFAANENFADVFISNQLTYYRLLANPAVVRVEGIGTAVVPPPPPLAIAPATKLVPEAVVRGGLDGYTGKGVIVAVVDSGIDFRHPDFVTTDAAGNPTSRLLYFWNTFDSSQPSAPLGPAAPLKYPNGTPVGTLYSRAQLNADLRSVTRRIDDPDPNTHGTAAAAIAAGNGRGSNGRWVGVAPEADLIAVRIGAADGSIPNMYLLNAITEWLFRVAQAEGKALVISCSFGGQFGPRNGLRVFERHLSSHFGVTPGRVMFVAAGNEKARGLHAKVQFGGADQPGMLAWCADGDSAAIQFYFSAPGRAVPSDDLVFEPLKLNWAPGTSNACSPPGLKMVENVFPLSLNTLSNETEGGLKVAAGPGGYRITSRSGQRYRLDAYFTGMSQESFFYSSLNVGTSRMQVLFPGEQISTPGTARYVMTIGSYDWNDQFDGVTRPSGGRPVTPGQLSYYSNPGYSRGAVIKPEVVAPGQWWTSSNARRTDGSHVNPKGVDGSGNYRIFNGTSAAAPYAAGIAALMLQKNPRLSMLDIKNYFMRNATSDSVTGTVPNADWGYGKLDYAAARRILAAVPSASAPTGLRPAKKASLTWPKN